MPIEKDSYVTYKALLEKWKELPKEKRENPAFQEAARELYQQYLPETNKSDWEILLKEYLRLKRKKIPLRYTHPITGQETPWEIS